VFTGAMFAVITQKWFFQWIWKLAFAHLASKPKGATMFMFKQQSASAQAALIYVTVGALILVWTTVWYFYLQTAADTSRGLYFLCAGSFMTGLVLLVIGLGVGHIGRSARQADSPVQAHPDVPSTTVPVVAAPNYAAGADNRMPLPPPQQVVRNT